MVSVNELALVVGVVMACAALGICRARGPRSTHDFSTKTIPYLCSTRTMYRILASAKEIRERPNLLQHPNYTPPQLLATAPNQVWSWDITKLLGPAKWTYYLSLRSARPVQSNVVGWMLAHRETGGLASRLVEESCRHQAIEPSQLCLHSHRGPGMTSHSLARLAARLGIQLSHNRPHVSNDNPSSEAQFKARHGHVYSITDAKS